MELRRPGAGTARLRPPRSTTWATRRKAAALRGRFMREVVANFDNEWEMTSADIDRVLEGFGGAAPAR